MGITVTNKCLKCDTGSERNNAVAKSSLFMFVIILPASGLWVDFQQPEENFVWQSRKSCFPMDMCGNDYSPLCSPGLEKPCDLFLGFWDIFLQTMLQ